MRFQRRLLAAFLGLIVLASGFAASVHAHLPRIQTPSGGFIESTDAAHGPGSCAICRLARESVSAALEAAGVAQVVPASTPREAPPAVPIDTETDPVRSPRAPPRTSLA